MPVPAASRTEPLFDAASLPNECAFDPPEADPQCTRIDHREAQRRLPLVRIARMRRRPGLPAAAIPAARLASMSSPMPGTDPIVKLPRAVPSVACATGRPRR
jgi:hypothetical protein